MEELKRFPKIIKDCRLQNSMTQTDVAEKLGISYQSYQAYEFGISRPSMENLIKLADIFDLSLDELVGRKHF